MTRIDELLADGVKASRRRKARAEKMLHELEFLESTDELRARECYILPVICRPGLGINRLPFSSFYCNASP